MSIKFLFVTDIHSRSEKDLPKNRTDNYYKSVLAKQEEIGEIIKEKGVDCLLFGGDMFHHFDPPLGLVNDVVAIWRTYNVKSIIGVIGSHDYNGYQVATLRRTGIGNFRTHKMLDLVGNDAQDLFPQYMSFGGVLITGTQHSAGLVDDPKNFATAVHEETSPHLVIQMVHGDLFNDYCPWPHQLITSIHPYVTADLVLSGHIHSGFPEMHIENPNAMTGKTSYVNPGSIGRTSIGKIRPIKVVLITVDDTLASFTFEYITLKNVVKDPFVEKSDVLEGSPVTDFTQLMKLISTLELRQSDYKTHIPRIVEEVCGDSPYAKIVIDRVYEILEQQKEH